MLNEFDRRKVLSKNFKVKNERKIEMYTKIQILFPFDSYSRKGLTILILQQVYGRLSYLAEFKHRLISCLFVNHADSR